MQPTSTPSIPSDRLEKLRSWAFAAAFVLCTVDVQRQWNSPSGLVFYSCATLIVAIWLGSEMKWALANYLTPHLIEIVVLLALSGGLLIAAALGKPAGMDVLAPLGAWAPLIVAWWGLSYPRLSHLHIVGLTGIFFLGLVTGLPPGSRVFTIDSAVLCVLILALTRFAVLRSEGDLSRTGHQGTDDFVDRGTGLFNRHYFEAELAHTVAVANRYHWPVSLLLIEVIDLPERWTTGDKRTAEEIERKVAWLIGGRLRNPDSAAHWSPGRFLVLLPNTAFSDAGKVAANLRKAILNSDIEGIGAIDAAVGVYEHLSGSDPMESVQATEVALANDLLARPQLVNDSSGRCKPS